MAYQESLINLARATPVIVNAGRYYYLLKDNTRHSRKEGSDKGVVERPQADHMGSISGILLKVEH